MSSQFPEFSSLAELPVSTDPYLAIWEGILRNQRKTRLISLLKGFPAGQASTELSFSEGLVLYIIESQEDKNIKELSNFLRLERSWVSRIVSGLEKRRLVKTSADDSDKRSKKIRISQHGREALRQLNAARKAVVEENLRSLLPAEQERLTGFLRRLADGLGAPGYLSSTQSHPVDAEIARISWEIGIVSDDVLGTGMGVTQYQLLYALVNKQSESVSASELYQIMPFDMSTVSRAVAALAEAGLLHKRSASCDRRSFSLTLTAEGRATWKKYCRQAAEKMRQALKDLRANDLQAFANLLEKTTKDTPMRPGAALSKKVEIKSVPERQLDATDRELRTEVSLSLGKGKQRFALAANDVVKGVIDLRQTEGSDKLEAISCAAHNISAKDFLKSLHACLNRGSKVLRR